MPNERPALPATYDLVKHIKRTVKPTGFLYFRLNTRDFTCFTFAAAFCIAAIHRWIPENLRTSWTLGMILMWGFCVRGYPRFLWTYVRNVRLAVGLVRIEHDRQCAHHGFDLPPPSFIACFRSSGPIEYTVAYVNRLPSLVDAARRAARAAMRQESQSDGHDETVALPVRCVPATNGNGGSGCEEQRLLCKIRAARPHLVSGIALRVDALLEQYEKHVGRGERRPKIRLYPLWQIAELLETPEVKKMLRQASEHVPQEA